MISNYGYIYKNEIANFLSKFATTKLYRSNKLDLSLIDYLRDSFSYKPEQRPQAALHIEAYEYFTHNQATDEEIAEFIQEELQVIVPENSPISQKDLNEVWL